MFVFKSFQHVVPEFGGYKAPSTADINDDDSLLEIGGGEENQEINVLDLKDFFPQKLVLRAFWGPIPKPKSQTQIILITQGEALKPGYLYSDSRTQINSDKPPRHAQYQNVTLPYLGIGKYQINQETFALNGRKGEGFEIIFQENDVVYNKPFAYEKRSCVTERVMAVGDGRIFVDPPKKFDVKVLRPYGGYYCSGISADECQQVYYDLIEAGDGTSVSLIFEERSQKELESTFFSPPLSKEQSLSLGGALCAGYGKVYLQAKDQKRLYQSTSYRHPGNNTGLIDVTFIPQQ